VDPAEVAADLAGWEAFLEGLQEGAGVIQTFDLD
jgi:hypothetical protein